MALLFYIWRNWDPEMLSGVGDLGKVKLWEDGFRILVRGGRGGWLSLDKWFSKYAVEFHLHEMPQPTFGHHAWAKWSRGLVAPPSFADLSILGLSLNILKQITRNTSKLPKLEGLSVNEEIEPDEAWGSLWPSMKFLVLCLFLTQYT